MSGAMRVVLISRCKLVRRLTQLFRRLKGGAVDVPEVPRVPTDGAPAVGALEARPEPCPVDERDVIVPKKRAIRHIIIGVDFGTSTTKVIWQDLSDNHFEAVRWHPHKDGLEQWLLPSTVLLRYGTMHFGFPESERESDGICFRSLKLCLLCKRKPSVCRCGNPGAQRGKIRLSDSDGEFPAAAFAALFLAYVFREVERKLRERFPDDELVLLWNIGCPMDYADADGYRRDWEELAGVAMGLRMEVGHPAEMALLSECAGRLDGFTVPAKEERNYFVQPEGLAAVKAFLESPDAEMKTYAIVDVGAGTTEVSFSSTVKPWLNPASHSGPATLQTRRKP